MGEGKINANGRGGSCSQSVQPHTHNNNHRHTGVWSGGGAHLVDNKKTHTHTLEEEVEVVSAQRSSFFHI